LLEKITEDVRNDRPISVSQPPCVYANTVIVSPRIARRQLPPLLKPIRPLPSEDEESLSPKLQAKTNAGTELESFSPGVEDEDEEWPLLPSTLPLVIDNDPPQLERSFRRSQRYYTGRNVALVKP
jgi:hypothetical protein